MENVSESSLGSNMYDSKVVEDILSHHGVLGMKWGHRNRSSGPQSVTVSDKGKKIKTSGGQGHPAHEDAVRARTSGQIAKKSGVKALSNKELQAYTQRLQLEQSVKRLSYNDKPAAKKFVLKLLGQTGQNTTSQVATAVTSQQVKKHLTKVALLAA
jgi:hypothetical protein